MSELTPAWTTLKPHSAQSRLWRSPARFKAAAAGRGSGKTEVARRYIVRWLSVLKDGDAMYFYGLPTYNQAKRVAWKPLKNLVPQEWLAKKPSESELVIETVFGTSLHLVGFDQPQRIEGNQWDGGIIDESSDIKPGTFSRSVLPALTHKNGWCWRIGVPKRYGIGAKEFKKFFDAGLQGKCIEGTNDRIESYSWPSSDILTPEQLAFAKSQLDAKDFSEQFEASWEDAGGLIYHAFNTDKNVKPVKYDQDRAIIVGSDFNVNPMCWVLAHIIEGKLHVFEELFIRNTNTQATLDTLHSKYPEHTAGWYFFGDASARARKTSARYTDLAQIQNDPRFKNKKMRYCTSNPPLQDRFAATNARLCDANESPHVYINPKCEKLVNDLESFAYKEGTREPDERDKDLGHISDAFGYIVHALWPIRITTKNTTQKAAFSID